MFSRWVALLGYAVGLLLLFHWGFDYPLVTVFPAWVMFLSIYILVTGHATGTGAQEQTADG